MNSYLDLLLLYKGCVLTFRHVLGMHDMDKKSYLNIFGVEWQYSNSQYIYIFFVNYYQ